MKVHLGQSLRDYDWIMITDDMTFYWSRDTSEINYDKFDPTVGHVSKTIQEWVNNCTTNGIKYLGYFDTDEYPSIDAYKKDYPEFFI